MVESQLVSIPILSFDSSHSSVLLITCCSFTVSCHRRRHTFPFFMLRNNQCFIETLKVLSKTIASAPSLLYCFLDLITIAFAVDNLGTGTGLYDGEMLITGNST